MVFGDLQVTHKFFQKHLILDGLLESRDFCGVKRKLKGYLSDLRRTEKDP